MPDSVTIDGVEFKKPPGKWEYGAVLFSPDRVLKLDYPHPNKQNTVEGEISILEDLNRRGAISVPKLHSSGVLGEAYPADLKGRRFMILERISEQVGLQPIDVLRGFIELKEFGYLHGDLKPSNVVFDGKAAVLVDFDQTIRVPDVVGMTMDELLAWGDFHRSDKVWRQCSPLRSQLEKFSFSTLARNPRLDLRSYPIIRSSA